MCSKATIFIYRTTRLLLIQQVEPSTSTKFDDLFDDWTDMQNKFLVTSRIIISNTLSDTEHPYTKFRPHKKL